MREWAEEMLEDENPDALFMDGLDEAIVGVTVGQAGQNALVVYDERKIIETLIGPRWSLQEEEDAWDHYGFNIRGAYFGENTPIIIKTPEER